MVVADANFRDLDRRIARLLSAEAVVETHMAFVFLTRDRAFKIKKAISLGYLDNRTPEARERALRAELEVNRPLAGETYLSVVPITSGAGGELSIGGEGVVIDWLLVMRRLPSDRMLDVMLAGGNPPSLGDITALCQKLTGFYKTAPQRPAAAYLGHLRDEALVNLHNLAEMRHHLPGLDPAEVAQASIRRIGDLAEEILSRQDLGVIVEGHGDLRPEHVCLVTPIVIFDRIEFSAEMRVIDVHDEVNYLGLECALLGGPGIWRQLRQALDGAGLPAPSPALLACYGLFRCLTRARLSLDHLRDASPRTPEKWPQRAAMYIRAAEALLRGAADTALGRAR